MGNQKFTVNFTGLGTATGNRDAINDAIKDAVGNDKISVMEHGLIVNNLNKEQVSVVDKTPDAKLDISVESNSYSNNIIQSILDAAQMIREGNGKEIAKYADHIYSLQTTVSLSLAKIGTQTKFIEFNQTRITNNLENMGQRQNDLEALVDTSLAAEITNRDMLDSLYTATLQMSASVIPQSIFNFI